MSRGTLEEAGPVNVMVEGKVCGGDRSTLLRKCSEQEDKARTPQLCHKIRGKEMKNTKDELGLCLQCITCGRRQIFRKRKLRVRLFRCSWGYSVVFQRELGRAHFNLRQAENIK